MQYISVMIITAIQEPAPALDRYLPTVVEMKMDVSSHEGIVWGGSKLVLLHATDFRPRPQSLLCSFRLKPLMP